MDAVYDSDAQWGDTDGDGRVDSAMVDADADGTADVQVTDTDADGYLDTLLADQDGDGFADVVYPAPTVVPDPFPLVSTTDWPTAEYSATGYSATGYAGGGAAPQLFAMSGDTASILGSINDQMSDASTIYRSALDPDAVSADDVEAAEDRIETRSRNSGLLEADIHQREVANDIAAGDFERSAREEASRVETDNWIETERAVDRADWAVWESRQARS